MSGTAEVRWYSSDVVTVVGVSGTARATTGSFGNICVIQWPCWLIKSVKE